MEEFNKKSQAVHIRDMAAFFLENKYLILYNINSMGIETFGG